MKFFENCRLCPRKCGINRLGDSRTASSGFCGETGHMRVAFVGPHFGEEPPITGKNGSGTVFFTGCSLKCSFCQNHQISRGHIGQSMQIHELFLLVVKMIKKDQVHNINLVTPDHFLPHAFELATRLCKEDYNLPVIYNLSGYQSIEMLRMAEEYVDIYLPDYKYADGSLAAQHSKAGDYPVVALEAIAEMVRQKGGLEIPQGQQAPAKKGVLVRHLILPGKVENSLKALTTIFLEFGGTLPLSLMSQYHPIHPRQRGELNRLITSEEFKRVYEHALELGFEQLFVQFPDAEPSQKASPYFPDFRQEEPFKGKKALLTNA
ncbi:radical SAM protein [Thermodesulfobacteriota bacterium]